MDEEDFERLEKIKYMIDKGYIILKEDLEWMVKKLKIQDTMINLMAPQLTTPIHGMDWVKKYYEKEAEKRICGK